MAIAAEDKIVRGGDLTTIGALIKAELGQSVGITGVTSQEDGTFVISMTNGDSITIDLNHDHPQFPKYELLASEAAYEAITTKDSDTLYLIPEV